MRARFLRSCFGAAAVGSTLLAACGLDLIGQAELATNGTDAERTPDPDPIGVVDASSDGAVSITDAGIDVVVEASTDAGIYTTRVTGGLVALYDFEENGGALVHDRATLPVDLAIYDVNRVRWVPHALELTAFTTISSRPSKFDKATNAVLASGELTMEAWIENRKSQETFGRILEMSDDEAKRNFALGTYQNDTYWAGMRDKEDLTATTALSPSLVHVVATRTTLGELRIYANGGLVSNPLITRPMTEYWGNFAFNIGNAGSRDRGWLGVVHLVAIYSRALTDVEILQNFRAGADP